MATYPRRCSTRSTNERPSLVGRTRSQALQYRFRLGAREIFEPKTFRSWDEPIDLPVESILREFRTRSNWSSFLRRFVRPRTSSRRYNESGKFSTCFGFDLNLQYIFACVVFRNSVITYPAKKFKATQATSSLASPRSVTRNIGSWRHPLYPSKMPSMNLILFDLEECGLELSLSVFALRGLF